MFSIVSAVTSEPNRVDMCGHCLVSILRRVPRVTLTVNEGLGNVSFFAHADCYAMAQRIWPPDHFGFPIVQEPEGTLALYEAEFPEVVTRIRASRAGGKARALGGHEMIEPFPKPGAA